jgi:hypothetical protein
MFPRNRFPFHVASGFLPALLFAVGCGSGSQVQSQDKSYTVQEAKDVFKADLEKNLAEIDADAKLTPAQKEANKRMMKDTFAKRIENWKE